MLNVAVTGNVASGKSTVVNWFAEWGATVIDADELVREAQRPGTETLKAIARRFGDEVLQSDGSLDRAALRANVLGDERAMASLNAIVHPVVQRRRSELAADAAHRGVRVLINDIPLLFEVLNPDDFDLVVLVDASPETRSVRLVERRGLDPSHAAQLMAAQIPSVRKRERSDIVIDNDGSLQELEERARRAWAQIKVRAR